MVRGCTLLGVAVRLLQGEGMSGGAASHQLLLMTPVNGTQQLAQQRRLPPPPSAAARSVKLRVQNPYSHIPSRPL